MSDLPPATPIPDARWSASWCAPEGDAIAPRAEFLAELDAAISRYAERTGTPESLSATLAAAYCDDRGRALRAGL